MDLQQQKLQITGFGVYNFLTCLLHSTKLGEFMTLATINFTLNQTFYKTQE